MIIFKDAVTSILSLLLLPVIATGQQLSLENYTPANGLVDVRVTKMFQDSKGRIYFLTREGFSIFDGQHFDNYANNTKNTDIVNDITEYADGTVKLFCFNGTTYEVSGNTVRQDTTQIKLFTEVNNVISISGTEKIIITNVAAYHEKNKKLTRLLQNFQKDHLLYLEACTLVNGRLLFSYNGSRGNKAIYLYDYSTDRLVDSMPGTIYSSGITDRKGNVFIFNNQWRQLDPQALQAGKLKMFAAPFDGIVPNAFKNSGVYFDTDNNAWFVNGQLGYCKVNFETKKVETFTHTGILFSNSSNIFQDAERNYWFMAFGSGVQKLLQSPLSRVLAFDQGQLNGVLGMNVDEQHNFFVQTSDEFYLNGKFIEKKINNSRPPSFYWQGQRWIFTDYKTLESNKGRRYYLDQYIASYKPEMFQQSNITIDQQGRLLIAGNVLIVVDTSYKFYALKLPYYADNVTVDDDNNYWAFCRGSYAVKCVLSNGRLSNVYQKFMPAVNPRFTIYLSDNRFASGTRNQGIVFFTWKDNELLEDGFFDKSKGLSNNFVYSLYKKNQQQLLAGTGTGLDIINFLNKDTICENLAIQNNLFTSFYSLVPGKDSSVYCLTANAQLFRLEKESRKTGSFLPVAWFKNIEVNGQPAGIDSVFSYIKNNFSFRISAPSFTDNKNIKYTFLLKGNGQQWQQNSSSADFSINNLLPGNYSLSVKVQYPGKLYPDQELHYNFVIKNPFWKQWWFIFLSLLVSLGLLIYFIRSYYLRQLEKQRVVLEKEQAVEKERTRIATDMHDDFGASLSRIKFISEKIQLQKNADEKTSTDLAKISGYSDEMAQKMNEIVWALNQRYDSFDDLISFCRAYAAEFLQDKNITLHFENKVVVPPQILKGETRRNIFLIVKESLTNIYKHALAQNVSLVFEKINDTLVLVIKDDGKGIDFNVIRPFSSGLQNMKKRAEEMGGTLSIETDGGTKTTVTVPFPPQ